MNKQTKRIKRNRKNKTRKYYGGSTNVNEEKSKGIFDVIGDKISGYSGKAFDYLKDKGLRLAGLQPIKQAEPTQNATTQEVDQKINELSDAASGAISGAKEIGSDIVNVVDKGSAAIVGQINDVLQSPKVEESVSEAAEETAEEVVSEEATETPEVEAAE